MIEKKAKEKILTSTIQIRVPIELREQFNAICKAKAINSSELIRQLITKWIIEQLDKTIEHNRINDIK